MSLQPDRQHPGRPMFESWLVPRGQMISMMGALHLHPSDMMVLLNRGRTPLWTRHMVGVIEAERDRRRRRKRGR